MKVRIRESSKIGEWEVQMHSEPVVFFFLNIILIMIPQFCLLHDALTGS